MDLTPEQRLDLLKIEMQLLQGVFDKYDSMIFTSRNWFVTLWMAALGLAFTAGLPILILLAAVLAVLYWALEGVMRHQYWYKYVVRYRALREAMNSTPINVEQLSLYDLTHHHGVRPSERERLRSAFGKREPIALYAVLGFGALVLWWLVTNEVIALPVAGG